jgi:hypothetical protein
VIRLILAEIKAFVQAIAEAAGDEEAEKRANAVTDTAANLESGNPVTGLPTLRELLDPRIVDCVLAWLGLDRVSRSAYTSPHAPWPAALDRAAFHGPLGRVTRLIAPHSEADAVAILVHIMTLLGTLAGRDPHLRIADDRHGLNENALFVGQTSKARKGLSSGPAKRLGTALDPVWSQDNLHGGLTSGEGLVDCVRDPITRMQTVKDRGQPPREELVTVDPGVDDKRALILESEFSRVLRVMQRPENTLSALIRQAWDGDLVLRVRARTNRLRATEAHISILGHISRDELLHLMDSTEAAGGFFNRFLPLCVQRARALPFGGHVPVDAFHVCTEEFREILAFAHAEHPENPDKAFSWSQDAQVYWQDVYPELSAAKPGLYGAVVARGEAHVVRLSCMFALADQTFEIGIPHLEAALEIWRYAEDSARYLFGDSIGDPTADSILRGLRRAPLGMTRTEIWALFGRNLHVAEIDRALLELGKARFQAETTGGRPAERWFACTEGTKYEERTP